MLHAMKLPPLNALKAFEASARHGSFSLAAQELGVTAAAVSMQVRNLEHFFGKTLFTRHNNRIDLTDAGAAIYRDAADSLSQIASLTQKLLGESPVNTFVISVLPALAERWLAPKLSAYFENTPWPIQVRIEDDPVDFSKYGIDLRITYGNHFYPTRQSAVLFQDCMVAVCHPDLLLAHQSLEQIPDKRLIHIEWGEGFYDHLGWPEWCQAAGVRRHLDATPALRAPNTSFALRLASEGYGVALVQASLARKERQLGTLALANPFELPLPKSYCAISSRSQPLCLGERNLIKHLQQPFV